MAPHTEGKQTPKANSSRYMVQMVHDYKMVKKTLGSMTIRGLGQGTRVMH